MTFKGISSVSMGLTMKTTSRMILPSAARGTVSVTQRAGTVDFGTDTYDEGMIQLRFSWIASTPEQSVEKSEYIYAWLYNDGKYYDLIFDNSPYKFYKAKVVNDVSLNTSGCMGYVDVTFTINPPIAFLAENIPVDYEKYLIQLKWDTAKLVGTQYCQEFEKSGEMRITNAGNVKVKPIIRLVNKVPSDIVLMHKNQSFRFAGSVKNDTLIIDCAAETVTLASTGENMFSFVDPYEDDFMIFDPGQVRLSISGNISAWPNNMYVIVDLSPGGA